MNNMLISQGSKLDLQRNARNKIIHLYSPEHEKEDSHLKSEIEVFIGEHGLKSVHTIRRLYECDDFMEMVKEAIYSPLLKSKKLTLVFWGHGNKLDSDNGFFKIFTQNNSCNYLFIDDLLHSLADVASERLPIQFLMTQCWAHCHNPSSHVYHRYLDVDWFTSHDSPETSARRWDSLTTGEEMDQEQFEEFLSESNNYEAIQLCTTKRYSNCKLKIFSKYLHYSSVHVEATLYISQQR